MSNNLTNTTDKIPIKTFQSRINDFKKSELFLKKLNKNNCLVSVEKINGIYEYILENGGIINLKKRIGSLSRYGIIYLTLNKFNKKKFATKLTIMNKFNKNEILISSYLSKISLNKLSPHFLFIYKTFNCYNNNVDQNIPDLIKNNNYYISVNELINGNLKNFFELNLSFKFIFNAFQQILLAILSFHYFTNGIYHNDCHYKNFLYVKIKSGGYFHYKIFGKNYYIKNMGYLWLIWDFGLARNELIYKAKRINDYFRIINFFNIKVAKEILLYENNNIEQFFKSSDKYFFEICIFKKKILTSNNTLKSFKIINNEPFIINDF